MKFLLDTNTCIIYMRGKNSTLKQKLETTATKDIAVCSIVKALVKAERKPQKKYQTLHLLQPLTLNYQNSQAFFPDQSSF
ncbi:MAG: hypothetical protein V7K97_23660 [Nostoc sp.]|uniref:hypothetical protein n=1 Tax=Nostoc sp. TaxID=1180 RepID=UPI002FFAC8D6